MTELGSVAKCESNVFGIDTGIQISGVHPNGEKTIRESGSVKKRDPQRIFGRKVCCDVLAFLLIILMLDLFLISKVSATEWQNKSQ